MRISVRNPFYRVMLSRARLCDSKSSVLLSVQLSVTFKTTKYRLYLKARVLKYTVSQKKLCQFYFVNNSVKHWPNLIIFGVQHREET